jgi:hypothetical protein
MRVFMCCSSLQVSDAATYVATTIAHCCEQQHNTRNHRLGRMFSCETFRLVAIILAKINPDFGYLALENAPINRWWISMMVIEIIKDCLSCVVQISQKSPK